ncbi:unnamed protein product [Mytilus edulis]|uniref:Uncharacterized protein n=1 Tax=Mytilus edulis TaxID=6550 RepID=A0A8S3V2N7_MYTED|nr:unnamed protein product [Mytilus edulis]
MTEDQKKEAKRVAHVKKQNTIADCISSDMNTCQAVVKPDCSKASLQKSTGIKKALKKVISHCIPYTDYSQLDVLLANRGLVFLDINEVPQAIRQSITKATVEFAGVKFKTKATSGGIFKSCHKRSYRKTFKTITFSKYEPHCNLRRKIQLHT